MQFSVLVQSLRCSQQASQKSEAQVHIYLPEGTFTLYEGAELQHVAPGENYSFQEIFEHRTPYLCNSQYNCMLQRC